MVNSRESLGETLEGRYATEHVGGAFNAKVIPKPRPSEKIESDATMGRIEPNSLYVENLSTERYKGEDVVISQPKQSPVLQSRAVLPPSVTPGQSVPRTSISAKTAEGGQIGRITQPTIPSVSPGQSAPRSLIVKATPSGSPSSRAITPSIPSATPSQSIPRQSVGVSSAIPGKGGRSVTIKVEPSGKGKPGYGHRPFVASLKPPFGPLISLPVPVYWNTDPDIWDLTKLYGQTYWDF